MSSLLSFAGITLTGFSPVTGPPTGGTDLLLKGRGFLLPVEGSSFKVAVGGEPCTAVEVVNDMVVRCSLPPGSGSGLTVSLCSLIPDVYWTGPAAVPVELQLEPTRKSGFSYDGKCNTQRCRCDPVPILEGGDFFGCFVSDFYRYILVGIRNLQRLKAYF